MEQQNWYEEQSLDDITLGQLEELCFVTANQRSIIDLAKQELKNKEEVLDKLEAKIMTVLDKFGKKNYKSAHALFYVTEDLRIGQPATPEAKSAFRNYLHENHLEDMLSVNSNTLKSYVKAQREIAFEENREPSKIPGLDEPMIIRRLNMRKGK